MRIRVVRICSNYYEDFYYQQGYLGIFSILGFLILGFLILGWILGRNMNLGMSSFIIVENIYLLFLTTNYYIL